MAFTKRYAGGIVTEIVNATVLLMELSSTDSISPEVGKESPAEKNSTNSRRKIQTLQHPGVVYSFCFTIPKLCFFLSALRNVAIKGTVRDSTKLTATIFKYTVHNHHHW